MGNCDIITAQLKAYYAESEEDFEIVVTSKQGDATEFARNYASKGEPIRIFAGGGDGTVNEVLNGIVGYENVFLGVLPYGSGNDFVRLFGGVEPYRNHFGSTHGSIVPVDIIKCNDRYCINICSVGLDADVAFRMRRYKRLFKGGSYILAVIESMVRRLGVHTKITIDDKIFVEQNMLLALAANGRFYGNGFISAPKADPFDGMLDILIVDKISRFRIMSFIGNFKSGRHEKIAGFVKQFRGKKMVIESKKPLVFNRDGECDTVKEITIEIMPAAIKMILPEGAKMKELIIE